MDTYVTWLVMDVICPCGPSCVAVGFGLPRCLGCGTRFMSTGNPYHHTVSIAGTRGPIQLTRAWPLRSIEGVPTKV